MTPSPSPIPQIADPTDWPLFWTIAGVIVAIIAIFVVVWAARRWGTRRNLLQVDYMIRPLRTIHLMTPKGLKVIEPNPPIQFDVELCLTNRGPQDILPEHFRGHELQFGVAPAMLIPDMAWSNVDSGILTFDQTYARLHPTRIAVGRRLYFRIRTVHARPDLWVRTPLTNVKVHRRRYRDQDADPMGTFALRGADKWLGSRVSEF